MVAAECGGWFRRLRDDKPGKFARYPLFKAVAKVECACENREAWAKATSSAGLAELMAAFASAMGASGKSMCHSWVAGVRCPWMTILSSCSSVTSVAVNSTITHPASQSWPHWWNCGCSRESSSDSGIIGRRRDDVGLVGTMITGGLCG